MKICLGEIRPVDLVDSCKDETLFCEDGQRRPVWLQEIEDEDFKKLLTHVRYVLSDLNPELERVLQLHGAQQKIADHELTHGDVTLYICFHADQIGRRVYLCVMGEEEGIDPDVFDRLDNLTVDKGPSAMARADLP